MAEAPEFYGGDGGGMVAVNPKPSKGFTSKAIDLLEKLFVKLMHDPSKPLHYLSGNFAPVREETPPVKDLPLQGYLPECLNGEFVRVGPNPKFDPVAGYHWFDGDGMIHGVRIKDGKATYVSRYVKTSRLKQEEFFGGAKFMKIGDLKGLFGLLMVHLQMLRTKLKVLDDSYGNGTANTALIYHHGKLLALQEADKPYVVKVLEDGDLQTLGMMDYDKRLTHSFTAHPKVDPITGEMFTFGYSHKPPYITYRVISKDGVMHDPVPITISEPIMMHDFAITENYAIFMDLPLHFKPKEMVKEKKMIYSFDPTKKARFGVLPRCAKDELLIRWFELPNCFIFHNANAWEEEDEVVLITCRLENPDLDMVSGNVKEKLENFNNELYEMRFNMATGAASQRKLSASAVDFPRVNECYTGRKQRYVYGTILDSIAKVTGIIKFDLHAEPEPGKTKLEVGGNIKGIFDLGPGRYGSEAIYVPRKPGYTAEEDDGYLIFFVHDENTGKSWVNVIDAKTMSADAVAVVELPHRVPYGFHAFFVAEIISVMLANMLLISADVIKILEDGDLQTLGIMDYDKRLIHSITAHPKVDLVTGEMFTFGYSLKPPYVIYRVIPKDGLMHDPVSITISEPVMMHDFAITENYAIFMDLPMYFGPKVTVKGRPIYFYDVTKKACFGILPRYARDELQIRWYETRFNMVTGESQRGNYQLPLENFQGSTSATLAGGNIKGIFELGPSRYGWEAIFVPRQRGHTNEEDDGYLIFFVYDDLTGNKNNVR